MRWDHFIGIVEEEATIIRSLATSKDDPPGYLLKEIAEHATSLLSLCEQKPLRPVAHDPHET